MFSLRIIVLLGFTLALSVSASADQTYREVRLQLVNSESVSHLYNPAFLNSEKPLRLDLLKVLRENIAPNATAAEVQNSVFLYAALINAMVDALNGATSNNTGRFFDIRGATAAELLGQLQSIAALNVVQTRVLKQGHVQLFNDLFLRALGIGVLDCTNLELPFPNPHCIFYFQ